MTRVSVIWTLHPSRYDCILVRFANETMTIRVPFAIFSAGIGILLAGVLPAQHSRIGPADIYPDLVRTPGAAYPQVTQRNIQGQHLQPPVEHKLPAPVGISEQRFL